MAASIGESHAPESGVVCAMTSTPARRAASTSAALFGWTNAGLPVSWAASTAARMAFSGREPLRGVDTNSLMASTPSSRSFRAAAVACAASAISGAGNFMTPIMPRTMSGGRPPAGSRPSPVERIRGPGTSPDSMRSRMHRVFAHIEPVSNTLVNPYAVKASRSCRSSSVGGIASAPAHIRSKK